MKIKTKYMVSLLGIIVVLSMNGYACTVQNPCYPHDPTKTLTQSCSCRSSMWYSILYMRATDIDKLWCHARFKLRYSFWLKCLY